MAEGAALDCGFPIDAAPGGGADYASEGSHGTRTHALPFRWDQRHGNIGLVEMGGLEKVFAEENVTIVMPTGASVFSLFGLGS